MQDKSQNPEILFNTQIDYSIIGEEQILPYVIEFDLENSILTPALGQRQRFCYQITGVGDTNSRSSDLTSFLLTIGDEITEDQIINISVKIDDTLQEITFKKGGNVELLAPEESDHNSKNAGLQFNFNLNRLGSLMTICFELATLFPVGVNPIQLTGMEFTVSGLTIGGPVCGDLNTCPAMFYQNASISVPVTIIPYAKAGTTATYCCGDSRKCPCTCAESCCHNNNCSFTVTQKICIAIPIEFGADIIVGSPNIDCEEPADDEDQSDSKASEIVPASTNVSSSDNMYFKNLFRAPRIYPRLR
jgi:hypothetical protein